MRSSCACWTIDRHSARRLLEQLLGLAAGGLEARRGLLLGLAMDLLALGLQGRCLLGGRLLGVGAAPAIRGARPRHQVQASASALLSMSLAASCAAASTRAVSWPSAVVRVSSSRTGFAARCSASATSFRSSCSRSWPDDSSRATSSRNARTSCGVETSPSRCRRYAWRPRRARGDQTTRWRWACLLPSAPSLRPLPLHARDTAIRIFGHDQYPQGPEPGPESVAARERGTPPSEGCDLPDRRADP